VAGAGGSADRSDVVESDRVPRVRELSGDDLSSWSVAGGSTDAGEPAVRSDVAEPDHGHAPRAAEGSGDMSSTGR
jgi:hypothetical protein